MISALRKFSSSIYAKIFLIVVAVPFIFWGMGPVFTGGNTNTIVKIGNKKFQTQEFVEFIKYNAPPQSKLDKNLINKLLLNFIGEKLIILEIKDLDIQLSDVSLSKIIKNEKIFQRNKKFSRAEYEKFLVTNSLNANTLENNILNEEKKRQLMFIVGGGIYPSDFLINKTYNQLNHSRELQVINLNEIFKKRIKFNDDEIVSYYNENKESYEYIYKTIKYIEINPQNLIGQDDFNDLFFQKIDEIDNLILEGKTLDFILKNFGLKFFKEVTFNKHGKDKNFKKIENFSTKLIAAIYNTDINENIILLEDKDKFYIAEIQKTETVLKKISDEGVKKDILLKLEKVAKGNLILEYIKKINLKNFNKVDFANLADEERVVIKNVKILNKSDTKLLKKEIVDQIYKFPAKKVFFASDQNLLENYLIYIDKVNNVTITKNDEGYQKYVDVSEAKIKNNLFNTYDNYLRMKYEIDVNYKALDTIENYFR